MVEYGEKSNIKLVIYENLVLDVTDFKHPGPQNLIDENIGTDITDLFEQNDHSRFAKDLCQKMVCGQMKVAKLMQNDYVKMSQEEIDLHSKIDKMIDIRKPLIPQVKKMNNKEFMAFVRRPRQLDNQDGIILFENNDENEKRDYMTNLMIILPIIFIMIGISYFCSSNTTEFAKTFTFWFYYRRHHFLDIHGIFSA